VATLPVFGSGAPRVFSCFFLFFSRARARAARKALFFKGLRWFLTFRESCLFSGHPCLFSGHPCLFSGVIHSSALKVLGRIGFICHDSYTAD
jgi:hypothetical protein